MKTNQGFILLIISIIIVVVLLGGIYFYQSRHGIMEQPNASNVIQPQAHNMQASENKDAATDEKQVARTKTCQPAKTKDEVLISGRVVFPQGIKNTADYIIQIESVIPPPVKESATYTIDPNGSFCAKGFKGTYSVIAAGSNKDSKGFDLGAVIDSSKDITDVTINNKTTAISWMLVLIGLSHPAGALGLLEKNPEVAKLANDIENASTLTSKSTGEGGELYDSYTEAIRSVLKAAKGL